LKIDINLLKSAYKKLKAQTYYDNSDLYLRAKIAEYEINLQTNLLRMEQNLSRSSDEITTYLNCLIENNVSVRCMPKKIGEIKDEETSTVISNLGDSVDYEIKKLTYYIDVPIEVHILGVIWILKVGCELDKSFGEYTYGNRLKDFNKYRVDSSNINLFKTYFEQYEMWRDNGINQIDKELNDGKNNVLMISLDIKDFFYSANIQFDKLREKIDELKINNEFNFLTDFIEKVFTIYTSKFNIEERIIIPIGFLPSFIIANWYLEKFDNSIIEGINPLYRLLYFKTLLHTSLVFLIIRASSATLFPC